MTAFAFCFVIDGLGVYSSIKELITCITANFPCTGAELHDLASLDGDRIFGHTDLPRVHLGDLVRSGLQAFDDVSSVYTSDVGRRFEVPLGGGGRYADNNCGPSKSGSRYWRLLGNFIFNTYRTRVRASPSSSVAFLPATCSCWRRRREIIPEQTDILATLSLVFVGVLALIFPFIRFGRPVNKYQAAT